MGGLALGALVVLLLLCLGLPLGVLVGAGILRLCSGLVGGEVPGWPMAVVVVVIGSLVQGFFTGLMGGADGGLLGALVGFFAWTATHAFLTGTTLARSAVIGLLMAFVQWLLAGMFVVLGLTTLLGAAVLSS